MRLKGFEGIIVTVNVFHRLQSVKQHAEMSYREILRYCGVRLRKNRPKFRVVRETI